jgi:protein-disulfide isomerase
MTSKVSHFSALLLALTIACAVAAASPARAQSFAPDQRSEIEKIMREYLLSHPELLQEAMTELEKRQSEQDTQKHLAAIKDNNATIFDSSRQVNLGNPNGDVTMVEFFDYNCSYCKRAMADMLDLLKTDSRLKVVLKEFPVLGEGSVEAAQVAVAVRMQDKSGKKYLDFHAKLLGGRGPADKARALAAAKEAGFDISRIEKDLQAEEVKTTLSENFKIAEALGLSGTPSYVFPAEVVIGAVGLTALKQKVSFARCGKNTC